ncbi:hypothetical protein [Leucobacter chironomi]|uniref:hypothetical protein n=1 Tax=Leucobacter chironomi TaxID=491918 RepID=UPI0004147DE5|nr:hypothetical protein [Leucobacter chironomi]
MTIYTPEVGPGLLTIGAPAALMNLSEQCLGAKLIPSVKKGDPITVLSGGSAPGDRTESHKLEVTLQSDFGVADSVTEWLWEHRGEVHPFVYNPNNSLERGIKGELTVEPIEIGGDVKTKPSAKVEFDLNGAPEFVDLQ